MLFRVLALAAATAVTTAQATGGGCPTGTLSFQGQCVTTCPAGTQPTADRTTCVTPLNPCATVLPGGYMNQTAGICQCSPMEWVVRNRTAMAPPIQMCAAAPPTGGPPVNCPSFVNGTVFDMGRQDCVCRDPGPAVIYNTADRLMPYACAIAAPAAGGTQYYLPCNITAGGYFSVLQGKCVMPPVPSPEATPKATEQATPRSSSEATPKTTEQSTPRPSTERTPESTPRSSPEATPKATEQLTPRPSQDPLPSREPTPRPSLSAQPTPPPVKAPAPSVAPLRRSAAPTPPPARSLPPTPRPMTLQTTLRLPGATLNQTNTANTTAALQNLQAAIGCSLRLPPERIQIRNVTVTTATGGTTWIPPPPAITGNGTVLCYRLAAAAGARLLSRSRRLSDEGVTVDYTVTNPPDELLALSADQMTATLTVSPMFQEATAELGATGASATTDSPFLGIVAPSPAAAAATPDRLPLIMGGVGAALGILAVSAAVILGILAMRRPAAATLAKPEVSRSQTVVVLDPGMQMNPMTAATAVATGHERVGFEPMQQRSHV